MSFSSSEEGKEKNSYFATCVSKAEILHTPLYTGLAVKPLPGSRPVWFLQKKSVEICLYRQQGGVVAPEFLSSAAICSL